MVKFWICNMDCEYIFCFHKSVKWLTLTWLNCKDPPGEKTMNQIEVKERKELEVKFASLFDGKIKQLSPELQQILIDDIVTAFKNRLNVLMRASEKEDN
jgi:hypothetical protein